MNSGKFILVDGNFSLTEEYRISLPQSESFLFSEKIRAVRTAFPFFRESLEMIRLKLVIFNQSFPAFTDKEGAGLRRQLERTLTKNKHFMGALLTVTFRLSDQKISYAIQSEKVEPTDYELNEKGLYVELFDKIQKPASSLSSLTLGSEIFWKIARNHLQRSTVDQFLLVNTNDRIIEVPESNLYLIKGKSIRGVSVEQGAYIDITRHLMLEIFKKMDLEYSEKEAITIQDIQDAEEIMTVNSIDGIRWIVGFEGKRFFNNTIRKISDLFSQTF